MKRSDLFFNIAIPVLFVGIVTLVVYKFIIKEQNPGLFAVKELSNISVVDLNNNKLALTDLLDKENETYCFLFELTNCYSCILEGLEDLKKIRKAGSFCIAIVVHDLIEEVQGWSNTQDFSPFFMIKKIDFYSLFNYTAFNKQGISC